MSTAAMAFCAGGCGRMVTLRPTHADLWLCPACAGACPRPVAQANRILRRGLGAAITPTSAGAHAPSDTRETRA